VHEVDANLNVLFASQHFEMLCDSDNNPLLHPIINMTFVEKKIMQRSPMIVHPISSILHRFILLPIVGNQKLEQITRK